MDIEKNKLEIKRKLEDFLSDPNLREFHPLCEEMLSDIDTPNVDKSRLMALYSEGVYNSTCYNLATALFYHSQMSTPRKRWYEE